jgi:flagellar hook-length control protein FliK
LAEFAAAPAAVEMKQRPNTSRQEKKKAASAAAAPGASEARSAGKADETGKPGKVGKSFAAALLGKLAEQVKGKRAAGTTAGGERPAVAEAKKPVRQEGRRRSALLRFPAAAATGAGEAIPGKPVSRPLNLVDKKVVNGPRNRSTDSRVRPQLVVIDLRSAKPLKKTIAQAPTAEIKSTPAAGENAVFRLVSRSAAPASGEFTPTSLAEPEVQALRQTGSPEPHSLLRAWQEKMVPELVKRTGIIVRDGGEGEIRLVLKPESLGSVRVRISINNNSIEGRIVVENNSVKELFDASLDNLKASLKQEGFQSASLEVAVGNQRNGREAEDRRPLASSPGLLLEEAAEEFDRNLAPLGVWAGSETRVNLVV